MSKNPTLLTHLAALRQRALELAGADEAQAAVYIPVSELLDAAAALVEGTVDERMLIALDTLTDILEDDLDQPQPKLADAGRTHVMSA